MDETETKQQIIADFLLEISNDPIKPSWTWPKVLVALRKYQRRHKITVRKSELVEAYRKLNLDDPKLYECLIKKPMRKQSGVMVVTVFTSGNPTYKDRDGNQVTQKFSCKHDCWYCPLERASPDNNWVEQPRSYLTKEPGVLRANANDYDCVKQMYARMEQYHSMGMEVDKLEVLVLGGTWSEYPPEYQEEFIRDIYYAANTFFRPRTKRLGLDEELAINDHVMEGAKVIGLTLETRPDTITLDEIKRMRRLGCTRIQLGVQHTNNEILKKCNRGHKVSAAIDAIRLLKDNCYKIDIHLMPNLRGASPEIDYQMFMEVLTNPELQVDQWKIYPCSVVPWSKFEEMYKSGDYKPYSDEELLELILRILPMIHPWIRVNRIIRDIPIGYISGGCSLPNMREVLDKKMAELGIVCKCIRSREIKLANMEGVPRRLVIRRYEASGGTEYFISYETRDEAKIFGFCRLRLPGKHTAMDTDKEKLEELKGSTAFIRELHTYGPMKAVSKERGIMGKFNQHTGIGKRLVACAEGIAFSKGYRSMVVISGVGVRNYYRRQGYTELTANGYLKKRLGCLGCFLHILNMLFQLMIFCG